MINEEIYNCSKEYIIKQLEQSYKTIDQLQSNWNSLREWLEKVKLDKRYVNIVLDKMNELEGDVK